MIFKVKTQSIYKCSLTRAFKTPILCDVTKIHTGFGFTPKVIYCTEDENWGQIGAVKKVFVAKSWTQKGGFASTDKIIERIENKYWMIEVSNFQTWQLGFSRFVGEWKTTEIEKNKILIEYTYSLHSDSILYYPANWLFAQTFWRMYMHRVLKIVQQLAYSKEPYKYL